MRRFVRGELDEDEIGELEADLDRRPSLRLSLAELALEQTVLEGAKARPSRAPAASKRSAPMHEGPSRLAVGLVLGEGGMGTVRQGVQTNLGRTVAVKTLRDETPSGTHRLLQEARLTARLQHPNIVPVHEIIQGHSGELQVVLKQVEGELWASVMHEPALLRARFGAEDALDWNLGVLIAVCNALAFAHERGVIHRDVKPRNVMVGNFGEVYLLDWGIAAMWGERTDPELAHVEDAPVAGTLAFMAPEQLEGDPDALGPWTDTYLLGATLYQLLGGRPPHAEAREAGSRARPRERTVAPLGSDAPRELVAIVEQALRPEPEDRIVTPQAFRSLLESFRSHRGSLHLVERAERSRRLAVEAQSAAERSVVESQLGEAEFGFRAALEAWPDNLRARQGLRDIAIDRIEAAFNAGHFQSARQLLDALADPPPELIARVELASEAEVGERAEATRAAWHQNPVVGVVVRGALLAAFAPLWVLGWLGFAIWPVTSTTPLAIFLLGYLVLGTVFVLSRGLAVLNNRLNRSNVLGSGSAVLAGLAWTLSADRLGLGVAATQVGLLLLFSLMLVVITVTSDIRGLFPALASVSSFAFAVFSPAHARHALAASAILVAGGAVLNNVLLQRRARTK